MRGISVLNLKAEFPSAQAPDPNTKTLKSKCLQDIQNDGLLLDLATKGLDRELELCIFWGLEKNATPGSQTHTRNPRLRPKAPGPKSPVARVFEVRQEGVQGEGAEIEPKLLQPGVCSLSCRVVLLL